MNNSKSRIGDWIQTYTSIQFYPMDPRAEDVCMEDIAHALANICRYNGHLKQFYSVAQHSVIVSRALPVEHALWGLLHDASEAYIADIPRPVKPYLAGYKDIERKVMQAVAEKYGLPWPEPEVVKIADNNVLATEYRDLAFGGPRLEWGNYMNSFQPIPNRIIPVGQDAAEAMFWDRFHEIKREVTK